MEIDDRQASQIHGIISSDSDSDYNSRDFDDEYYSLKPPPLDYQSIKDKIVVICREQGTNVWDDEETIIGVASNVTVLTKKKKKKPKTKVGNKVENAGAAAVNREKVQIKLPLLKTGIKKKKTRSKAGQSTVKCNPPKVVYDPQTLKDVEEKISELKSVWHTGLHYTIVQQELSLQRQRESSMYESWMKSAGIEIKPQETKKKQEKTVVSEKKTEKESKQPAVVKEKSNPYEMWRKLAGIKTKSKETKKEQENTVKNEKKTKKKSKQPVVKPSSTNLAKKDIKKNTPKKKAAQILKNSEGNNTQASISTSPVDFWWNYDNLASDQSRLLAGFTNDIKYDAKFKNVKGTTDTTTEIEKKVGAKKTWAQLFEKPEETKTKRDQNKSQVKPNIKEAGKSFYDEEKFNLRLFGTEIIKNEIPEKDETQIVQNVNGRDTQNSNFGLLDKETVQSVWYFNNFNFNDTQYLMNFSNDTERDSRLNINIEEVNSTTKTKKRRSKKKSKQSIDILMNQSLSQNSEVNLKETMPKHVKETWEMFYEEGKPNHQPFDREVIENEVPEKDDTQIVQNLDAQNSNFVLLDKETLRNEWRFDNFVDEKISCFAYFPNDTGFNIDIGEANSTPKSKKRTRSKKKSKKSVDNLTNQTPDGNNYMHSKEILDDEEKLIVTQLLDEDLVQQMWFLPNNIYTKLATEIQEEIRNEDFNLKDPNQDGASAVPKPKKKKKKQSAVEPPLNEVGQDSEKTNEDTVEYSVVPRENWDLNFENLQVSKNNNKEVTFGDTATSEEPQQAFGDDFRDFIRNIYREDPTIISNLTSFDYEQLEKLYLAYQEKNFKGTNQVNMSVASKPKKKKKKTQSTVEPPLNEVGQDSEKTNEDTVEYSVVPRENWDLNSENLQVSKNNNKEVTFGDTATSEEPQQAFGDDFRDFIRNIYREDPTIISNLTSFDYEQLEKLYLAYQEKNFKGTNQVNMSVASKPKKKKKKTQSTVEPPLNEVGQDSEKTNEDTVEYSGVPRENWDLNSENLQVSKNNNKEVTFGDTATSEEPQQVFGDDFRDFIRNIYCEDPTIISNLNSFDYEQLEKLYLAYQEKNCKGTNQVNVSVASKSKTKKKKKSKQSTAEPPLKEISHESLQVSMNKNKEMTFQDTATSEATRQVFGDDFRDFIRNICCEDSTVVSNLNSFSYEQLERSYLAYREKKNVTKQHNAVTNDVTAKSNSKKRCQKIKKTVNDKPILTDGDRLLNSLPDDDKLLYSLTDGGRHLNSLTAGDRLLNSLTAGDRLLNSLTPNDRPLNSLTDDYKLVSSLTEPNDSFHPTNHHKHQKMDTNSNVTNRNPNNDTVIDLPTETAGLNPEDGTKTSVLLPESTQIEEKRSVNSSTIVLEANSATGNRFIDTNTTRNSLTDYYRLLSRLTEPNDSFHPTDFHKHQKTNTNFDVTDRNPKNVTVIDPSMEPAGLNPEEGPKTSVLLPESTQIEEKRSVNSSTIVLEANSATGNRFIDTNTTHNSLTDYYRLLSRLTEPNDSFHPTDFHKHQKTNTNFDVTDRNPKNVTVIDPSMEPAGLNPEEGPKTSVLLPESTQIEEKRSVNSSTIVLEANSATGNRFIDTNTTRNSLTDYYRLLSRLTEPNDSFHPTDFHKHQKTNTNFDVTDRNPKNVTVIDPSMEPAGLNPEDGTKTSVLLPESTQIEEKRSVNSSTIVLEANSATGNRFNDISTTRNSLTDYYKLFSSSTEPNDSFHPTNCHKHQKTNTNFDITDRNPKNVTVIDPTMETAGLNPEEGAKTSVSLPESSQIEEKQSINSSTIVLKANSAAGNHFNDASTSCNDFEESFDVFARTYNDALGYRHISTYNSDHYKKLYRILYERTNKTNSDSTKKAVDNKPIANYSTRDRDRLLRYLTQSNDGLKSKSQGMSTYTTSTAGSRYRHCDRREIIASNQHVRSIAPFSKENRDFYGHSSRCGENYRRERDFNENFGSVSHTAGYNSPGDLSNDKYHLNGDTTGKKALYPDDDLLTSALLQVFVIVMAGIAIITIIANIVSFLYNNIFFVGLLFLIFMKFKS